MSRGYDRMIRERIIEKREATLVVYFKVYFPGKLRDITKSSVRIGYSRAKILTRNVSNVKYE
jgi:hypothetical protein